MSIQFSLRGKETEGGDKFRTRLGLSGISGLGQWSQEMTLDSDPTKAGDQQRPSEWWPHLNRSHPGTSVEQGALWSPGGGSEQVQNPTCPLPLEFGVLVPDGT